MSLNEENKPVTELFHVPWDRRFDAVKKAQGNEHPVLVGYLARTVEIRPIGPHGNPHELPFKFAEILVTYERASEVFAEPCKPGPRYKTLKIGTGFLPLLLGRDTRHSYEVHDGLPRDTRIVNCRMSDDMVSSLVLLLESSEFDEVPDGSFPPEISPTFKRIEANLLSFDGVN